VIATASFDAAAPGGFPIHARYGLSLFVIPCDRLEKYDGHRHTAAQKEVIMNLRKFALVSISAAAVISALAAAQSRQAQPPPAEQERRVTESEVPKPALEALRKLANGAAFTAFAEEIEHGHTFYEGSWRGPHGNIDALVTDTGDLVEIEETVPTDKVASAARDAAQKAAGPNVKLTFEKKTMVLYEVHYQRDGKGHELILTPDGRTHHEEGENGNDEDENG
jgi:hypothetical protein